MDNPAGCTALILYSRDDDTSTPDATADATAEEEEEKEEDAIASAGGDAVGVVVPGASAAGEGSSGRSGGGDAVAGERETSMTPLPPRFVGLSNQGATCYMNSLLQTLYMTPEVCALIGFGLEGGGRGAREGGCGRGGRFVYCGGGCSGRCSMYRFLDSRGRVNYAATTVRVDVSDVGLHASLCLRVARATVFVCVLL